MPFASPKKQLLRTLLAATAPLAACAPPTAAPDNGLLTPPFAVSDHFAATGYEGDGANPNDVNIVKMVIDACPTRAPGAVGDCYSVTYDYGAADAANGWAGVVWQYPANNWGLVPGHSIAAGATSVTVWARGAEGGERVELLVGGAADPTLPYQNSINVSTTVVLTTEWQAFAINFGPATYSEVLSGFGWSATKPTVSSPSGSMVFYLDGITWGM